MRVVIVCMMLASASVARADGTATPDAHATPEPHAADDDASATGTLPELRTGSFRARLHGSLRPTVGAAYHADGVDRDRWAYGVSGSRIDAGLDIHAGAGVSAALYVQLASDEDAGGDARAAIELERALVAYEPHATLRFSVGRDQVPLSAQSATPTTARVFLSRIALDDTFVLPVDVGAQARLTTELVSAYAGVWNGVASDVMLEPGATERGLLYSARVEATPLGTFDFDESKRPSSVIVGVGAAATYRASTTFAPTGTRGARARDLRAALALRVAWRGLFVQTEVLRRQITDDLSMRPDVATGGYVQASWRVRAGRIDVTPLARAGLERVRQLSAPASGSSVEIGAAVFPLARGSDRLQISAVTSRSVDPDYGSPTWRVLSQVRLGF